MQTNIQPRSDFQNKSFETILREKLEILSRVDDDPSTIRYSMTKQNGSFSGILLVESPKGKFFATAVASSIDELTQSLMSQVMKLIPSSPRLRALSNAH